MCLAAMPSVCHTPCDAVGRRRGAVCRHDAGHTKTWRCYRRRGVGEARAVGVFFLSLFVRRDGLHDIGESCAVPPCRDEGVPPVRRANETESVSLRIILYERACARVSANVARCHPVAMAVAVAAGACVSCPRGDPPAMQPPPPPPPPVHHSPSAPNNG